VIDEEDPPPLHPVMRTMPKKKQARIAVDCFAILTKMAPNTTDLGINSAPEVFPVLRVSWRF
jgi:hypothetical protein